MDSTILFPSPIPSLKLARPSAEKWAAALREERRRLMEDQEALREREQNLREYEARLRALQEEFTTNRQTKSAVPADASPKVLFRPMLPLLSGNTEALKMAWEKLHRTRELLAAEQAHVREDRHALREQETAVKRREEAVAAREQALAEREAYMTAELTSSGALSADEHPASAVSRLSRMPFDLARSVFGGKK